MNHESTMPHPPELAPYTQTIAIAGKTVHYYDTQEHGAPIVLLHGLGDEADTWRHVIPALAPERRVIALDLPGFGGSELPKQACSGAVYAGVLAELLNALALPPVTLAGHSMGAAITLRLALAQPARVERLVLIAGSLPIAEQPAPPSKAIAMMLIPGIGERYYTGLRRSLDDAEATLRPYYYDYDSLPAEDRAFLRERVWARVWSDKQRSAFFSALRWMAIDGATRARSFRTRLAALHLPTEILWGVNDVVAPPSVAEDLTTVLPDARLTLIERCGHNVQQERPDLVISTLRAGAVEP